MKVPLPPVSCVCRVLAEGRDIDKAVDTLRAALHANAQVRAVPAPLTPPLPDAQTLQNFEAVFMLATVHTPPSTCQNVSTSLCIAEPPRSCLTGGWVELMRRSGWLLVQLLVIRTMQGETNANTSCQNSGTSRLVTKWRLQRWVGNSRDLRLKFSRFL